MIRITGTAETDKDELKVGINFGIAYLGCWLAILALLFLGQAASESINNFLIYILVGLKLAMPILGIISIWVIHKSLHHSFCLLYTSPSPRD